MGERMMYDDGPRRRVDDGVFRSASSNLRRAANDNKERALASSDAAGTLRLILILLIIAFALAILLCLCVWLKGRRLHRARLEQTTLDGPSNGEAHVSEGDAGNGNSIVHHSTTDGLQQQESKLSKKQQRYEEGGQSAKHKFHNFFPSAPNIPFPFSTAASTLSQSQQGPPNDSLEETHSFVNDANNTGKNHTTDNDTTIQSPHHDDHTHELSSGVSSQSHPQQRSDDYHIATPTPSHLLHNTAAPISPSELGSPDAPITTAPHSPSGSLLSTPAADNWLLPLDSSPYHALHATHNNTPQRGDDTTQQQQQQRWSVLSFPSATSLFSSEGKSNDNNNNDAVPPPRNTSWNSNSSLGRHSGTNYDSHWDDGSEWDFQDNYFKDAIDNHDSTSASTTGLTNDNNNGIVIRHESTPPVKRISDNATPSASSTSSSLSYAKTTPDVRRRLRESQDDFIWNDKGWSSNERRQSIMNLILAEKKVTTPTAPVRVPQGTTTRVNVEPSLPDDDVVTTHVVTPTMSEEGGEEQGTGWAKVCTFFSSRKGTSNDNTTNNNGGGNSQAAPIGPIYLGTEKRMGAPRDETCGDLEMAPGHSDKHTSSTTSQRPQRAEHCYGVFHTVSPPIGSNAVRLPSLSNSFWDSEEGSSHVPPISGTSSSATSEISERYLRPVREEEDGKRRPTTTTVPPWNGSVESLTSMESNPNAPPTTTPSTFTTESSTDNEAHLFTNDDSKFFSSANNTLSNEEEPKRRWEKEAMTRIMNVRRMAKQQPRQEEDSYDEYD